MSKGSERLFIRLLHHARLCYITTLVWVYLVVIVPRFADITSTALLLLASPTQLNVDSVGQLDELLRVEPLVSPSLAFASAALGLAASFLGSGSSGAALRSHAVSHLFACVLSHEVT